MHKQNRIDYVKMHGIGNDYVFVSALDAPLPINLNAFGTLARSMSDRHRGVGSDGLILISKPESNLAHVRMQIWNADGSSAEFCGNGLRCVARLCRERFGIHDEVLRIDTGAGVLGVRTVSSEQDAPFVACVDIGTPRFGTDAFLIDKSHVDAVEGFQLRLRSVGAISNIVCVPVSVGNPHVVLLVDDLDQVHAKPFEWIGPLVEIHPAFPEHVNVHAVKVVSRSHLRMQSWERGVGLTRSCGSGACAAVVAARILEMCDTDVCVELPGGKLSVSWDNLHPQSHMTMTGGATYICAGHVYVLPSGELVDAYPSQAAFLPL
ncbi:MAG: diaminopimelate epimerase [Phycisphaeraceae bacterium]|nr:diaminopimelate epimerase [Phycisphaerales bacterium]MCB9860795.1 diaminopimelate epimerase [Phycisphaeraceae bacterium]